MPLINTRAEEISAAEPDVVLAPGGSLEEVLPRLAGLAVIAVEFPKFRDGRGFTTARALRERHFYKGDLRATGHFLPDQFAFLIACGFTSFETPAEHNPAQFAAALAKPHQPGQLLRRSLARALEAG
ncbi:MAG: DUF934 domain-containing protein [Rhodospirillales bacterium]|nr:DUF934 domain-containing protein [Rhodospirillales bacterium]MDE2318349.1 DUF934 domain-containing protein [Rhodospirillales bacterium]